MTHHGMPFLILNLGVEKIFVLHSRLEAQAVPADKAEDVMRDIGTNLFSAAFVTELFSPQPLYTPAAVMQIFATLSQSTVMHLSENSMKKLYDLVFMTVKYQTLTLRHPLELYELTLNHLETVLTLVPASVHPLIQETTARVHSLAASFSLGDWAAVRRSLLNFFGGRHVRVSVFLDNKVQSAATGAFFIPKDTALTPLPACRPPGLVTMCATRANAAFEHPDTALGYPPSIPPGSWEPTVAAARMTTNGFDMYAAAKAAPGTAAAAAGGGAFADPLARQTQEMPRPRNANAGGAAAASGAVFATSAQALSNAESQQAYDGAVNFLARIAGAANRAPGVQTFELELFEEPVAALTSAGPLQASTGQSAMGSSSALPPPPSPLPPAADTTAAATAPPAVPLARMSAGAVQEQNRRLLGIMNDFDAARSGSGRGGGAAAAGQGAGGSDLLDIMDEI